MMIARCAGIYYLVISNLHDAQINTKDRLSWKCHTFTLSNPLLDLAMNLP